jgi:hypothetical protein
MTGTNSKLSSEDIIKRLEMEAQEARSQQTLGMQETLLAAKAKKSYPSLPVRRKIPLHA